MRETDPGFCERVKQVEILSEKEKQQVFSGAEAPAFKRMDSMRNMTLRRIADACGGILHEKEGMGNQEVECIVTDSRQAGPGSLFAAIKGERVDAHKFIPAVFDQGAMCVLSEQELPEDTKGSWIKVISTLQALKDIAEYYLRQLNIPVVGITGSVGKTSTKEMIAAVLSQKYQTLKTLGNFNNELGLPLTVFRLREEDEIAVLEMGISDFGEMHRLAKIARPDTCVITNIGQCHLEFLKDRDGILRAKTEIFDFLKPDGHIILNGNDDKLITVRNVDGIEPVFFGLSKSGAQTCVATGQSESDTQEKGGAESIDTELSVWADEIQSQGLKGISCRIHTEQGDFSVLVPIPGQHMVLNALAGTAVGLTYDLTLEEIKAGIESLQSLSGRFHIIDAEDYTIIDDCYNANPVSVKAAIDLLGFAEGRKVAILGDMFELGSEEENLHREVGRYAAAAGIDSLICIGKLSRLMYEAALADGAEAQYFENNDTFLSKIRDLIKAGDSVLVKASHGMHFTQIVETLQKL